MNKLDQMLSEGTALEKIPTDTLIEIVNDKDLPNAFLPLMREEYIRRLKLGSDRIDVTATLDTAKKVFSAVEKNWKKLVDDEIKKHVFSDVVFRSDSFRVQVMDDDGDTQGQSFPYSVLEDYL